jgi:hypothetical protein
MNELLTSPGVQRSLALLLEGYAFARDVQAEPSEFAVDLETLATVGGTLNVLRWLLRRGYAEQVLHSPRDGARHHQHKQKPTAFPPGSRFFLTDQGVAIARARCPSSALETIVPGPSTAPLPVWDGVQGKLLFLGQVVKRLRYAASNQRIILEAFHVQGWPPSLHDPLPRPAECVNVKQRLHDTIKNLNRSHEIVCLRFHGAEAGRAVGWKCLSCSNCHP